MEDMIRREKMLEWAEVMSASRLPAWSELPDLELYMDQVVSLVSGYLAHLGSLLGEDKPITPAMVNNYVKMGLLRPPVKKRYRRVHLASLIMICLLKRTLNMADIQKLIPKDMPEEQLAELYEFFRRNRATGIEFLAERVRSGESSLFPGVDSQNDTEIVIQLAIMAHLLKLGAEKLVGGDETPEKPKKEKKSKA